MTYSDYELRHMVWIHAMAAALPREQVLAYEHVAGDKMVKHAAGLAALYADAALAEYDARMAATSLGSGPSGAEETP